MIPVPRREHKILVAIHGWAGVTLGLLLLVIVATGTVAVMGEEIGQWSDGVLSTRSPLSLPLDRTVSRLLDEERATSYQRISLFHSTLNNLTVLFSRNPGRNDSGVRVEAGLDGRVIDRREGTFDDILESDPAGALKDFLVNLHVRLYIPEPVGYVATGAAGLSMMVVALSGFFIHRHLVTDVFTIRRLARPVVARRDRHGVAAAWLLPFAVILAFTGSYLSFAGSVGIPALAFVSFGGDEQKLIAALIGAPPPSDPVPARGADLDAILGDAAARTGRDAESVAILHPGRADASVEVQIETGDGALTPETLVYEGLTGRFVGERPAFGKVASAGGTAMRLMGPLHFGDFAGVVSKLAWVALGFATCFAIVSGLRLWLARRPAGPLWVAFDKATSVTAFGLPLAIGTAAAAFFAAPATSATVWTKAGFLAGTGAAGIAAFFIESPKVEPALRMGAGVVLLALPLLRLAAGGPGWGAAFAAGEPVIVLGDLTLVLIAVVFPAPLLRRLAVVLGDRLARRTSL